MLNTTEQNIKTRWKIALDVLKPSRRQLEHGLELHRQSLVCDSFAFMPNVWNRELFDHLNRMLADGAGVQEWSDEQTYYRFFCMTQDPQAAGDFVKALQAPGVTAFVQTVGGAGPMAASLPNIAARLYTCHVFNKYMFQAVSADQIRLAKKQDRVAVIFSVNGPLGEPSDQADTFKWMRVAYHLGVRFMHLAYNRRNHVAGGCTEERDDGLSDFGRDYVKQMNEVGVIVDTSHASRQSTLDAAEVSSKPIMATHIGLKRLFNHSRCKTDEELKAIARTGGLIGIYNYPDMLGVDGTIATLLDHVDAAARLIGPEHVSIGTDVNYCPGVWAPKQLKLHPASRKQGARSARAAGWKKEHFKHMTNEHLEGSLAWTNWPLITVGLVMRGHKDETIRKIIGGNLLRVLDANRPAREVRI
jgi:membrane dipeptidase